MVAKRPVVVGRLDPASIRLLVHSVVGGPPSFDLSAEIAAEISPADLRIATTKRAVPTLDRTPKGSGRRATAEAS